MFNSFPGKSKKPDTVPVSEPRADASGAFLHTVPLPMIVEEDEEQEHGQAKDLLKMSPEQRLEAAMQIVDLHHHRVAKTIRTMWGAKECSDYISKLILSGVDGTGHSRIGFNQEAVDAMLVLGELHDAQFGTPPPHPGAGFDPDSGFSDSAYRANWDSLR